MDIKQQMKTTLPSYDIWYDGSVVIKASEIEQFITKVPSNRLFVEKMTDDIKQFNQLMAKSDRISTKAECDELNFGWNLPESYKTLDVKEYVLDKLASEPDDFSDKEFDIRGKRVLTEITKYQQHDLTNMLRCLIYIVDELRKNDVVWGVGRGSSVSSYVLYLIGVHDIDSVAFDLPFTDFIKT